MPVAAFGGGKPVFGAVDGRASWASCIFSQEVYIVVNSCVYQSLLDNWTTGVGSVVFVEEGVAAAGEAALIGVGTDIG
jgi:hypothetical protein